MKHLNGQEIVGMFYEKVLCELQSLIKKKVDKL